MARCSLEPRREGEITMVMQRGQERTGGASKVGDEQEVENGADAPVSADMASDAPRSPGGARVTSLDERQSSRGRPLVNAPTDDPSDLAVASAGHPRELDERDRIAVVAIAKLLRAAVLRSAEDEADRIADRVVERLRHAPPAITEPEALFMSVGEAARILGITRAALDKRIQRGQVPGVVRTAGRRVQLDRARFLAGLAKRGR